MELTENFPTIDLLLSVKGPGHWLKPETSVSRKSRSFKFSACSDYQLTAAFQRLAEKSTPRDSLLRRMRKEPGAPPGLGAVGSFGLQFLNG